MKKKVIIAHRKFLQWAYTMEGYIFYRPVDPSKNDSDIELYQVQPNKHIKKLIESF